MLREEATGLKQRKVVVFKEKQLYIKICVITYCWPSVECDYAS